MASKPQIETKDVVEKKEIEIEMPLKGDIDRVDLRQDEGSEFSVPRHLSPGTPGWDMYIRDLKFMEEPVTFMIAEGNKKEDEPVVPCGVNGENRFIERGKPYTLPRKFLNVLIVNVDEVSTVQTEDPDTKVQITNVKKARSLKYPVQILKDSEIGHKWFIWKCNQGI